MTWLVASVASEDEAEIACAASADVVAFEDPARRALGALSVAHVWRGIQRVGGRALTSATVGDLGSRDPVTVAKAVEAVAATGVDFVKIGLLPDGDTLGLLRALGPLAAKYRLTAVLFADLDPDFGLLQPIADAGLEGVTLDVALDTDAGLLSYLSLDQVALFLEMAEILDLSTGLAGQITGADAATLAALDPDYLELRSALYRDGKRW